MTTAADERVFLRKASGLIKTASNTDVFIFDIGLVSIGLGLAFILFFGPGFYPGANLYVSTILAGLAMLAVGGGMICWTVTIPRSGGVYDWDGARPADGRARGGSEVAKTPPAAEAP